jgi:AcrR family transcriptional regulator
MANSPPKKTTRTLDRAAIVDAALKEMDEAGEVGFSLRKVAARAGCDPMAVIYHLGSRYGLERAVADAITGQVPLPDRGKPWREQLSAIADGYRQVALRHPRSFPLLQRFWTTGPSDYVILDRIYGCLDQTGLALEQVKDCGIFFVSAVMGFCTAEARGMLSLEVPPASASELAELDRDYLPVIARIAELKPRPRDELWHHTRNMILDGIEQHLVRSSLAREGGVSRA